ncbi:response regulator, partial [Accumulibacter sp.]
AERLAAEEAARREAERRAAEEAARIEAERLAAQEAARIEAERLAVEEALRREEEERKAVEEAIEREIRRQAEQEAARREAERRAAEEAARREAERRAAEEAARREAERLAAAKAAAARVKSEEETVVMVADDSKVVRVKTSRVLTARRYQVVTAEDGLDAARQIEQSAPDVLITDVDMPGMNGLQLAKLVRARPQTARLPIIMITSDNDQLRAEAEAAGVDVVLGKPYPEEQLIGHIQNLVRNPGGRR